MQKKETENGLSILPSGHGSDETGIPQGTTSKVSNTLNRAKRVRIMPFNTWAFGGNIYILNSGYVLEFIYKSPILWEFIGVLWTVLNSFLSGAWFPFSETNAWKWDRSVTQCVDCLNNQSRHHPQWPHLPTSSVQETWFQGTLTPYSFFSVFSLSFCCMYHGCDRWDFNFLFLNRQKAEWLHVISKRLITTGRCHTHRGEMKCIKQL